MFVMDEHYKQLLADFNEAMKQQLIKLRLETIKVGENFKTACFKRDFEVIGKCFLGYRYSKIHPIQTMRAKKIWAILNGSLDNYLNLYGDGVICGGFDYDSTEEPDSENMMLYLGEEPDNWNEFLDREKTDDIQLIHSFHFLFTDMDFSIFDLLWVRGFNVEIHLKMEYDTYPKDEKEEEITFTWD